jgi:FkbM family methyltransferase|tara:strand:- start:271 stop:1008 length:738 start_codon:yes stop_codon:yes gene_type:complete
MDTMDNITIDGYKINYYKCDNTIASTLKKGEFWDKHMLPMYQKYYRPKSDILDIGGFIGTNSLLLSKVISSGNKIHVFEPQYFDCLQKNITDNNLSDVVIPYKNGLSNVTGFIKANNIDLQKEGNYGGLALTTLHTDTIESQLIDENSQTNIVELKRLDDFNFSNIGLIKMDVEGFELLVLQGALTTLSNNNYPPILLEIWDVVCWRRNHSDYYNKNKQNIIHFLVDLDYKMVFNQNEDYVFIHD